MELIWYALFGSFCLLIVSLLYKFIPNKRKSWFFGYWIPDGPKGDNVWKCAHDYFSTLFIASVFSSCIITLLGQVLIPSYVLMVWGVSQILFGKCSVLLTERHLKNRFDRHGNPRIKPLKTILRRLKSIRAQSSE